MFREVDTLDTKCDLFFNPCDFFSQAPAVNDKTCALVLFVSLVLALVLSLALLIVLVTENNPSTAVGVALGLALASSVGLCWALRQARKKNSLF